MKIRFYEIYTSCVQHHVRIFFLHPPTLLSLRRVLFAFLRRLSPSSFFQLAFAGFSFKKRIIERIKLALGDSKNYIKVYDCRAEGSCCIRLLVCVCRVLGSLFMEYLCVLGIAVSDSSSIGLSLKIVHIQISDEARH